MPGTRYQPQGLLRIARTPLAAGLRIAILPGLNRAYDAASARFPVITGTKPGLLGTSTHAGFYSTFGVATTDGIATGFAGAFPATGRSYFFRARRNGSGGSSLGRLYDNTGSTTLGTFLCWENSNTRLRYGFYGAGAERAVAIPNSATTAAVGEWFEILFTHAIDGQGVSNFNAWVNGEQVVSNVTSTNALNDNPTAELVIGNRSSGTRGWDGLIECAYVWDRVLTASDAAALRQNRYQLYDDLADDEPLAIALAAPNAYTLAAGSASLALAGNAAQIRAARKSAVSAASLTTVGAAVALRSARRSAVSPASLSASGLTVLTRAARKVGVSSAALAINYGAVQMLKTSLSESYSLAVSAASLAASGASVGLRVARRVAAQTAAFSWSANPVALRAYRRMPVTVNYMAASWGNVMLTMSGPAIGYEPNPNLVYSAPTESRLYSVASESRIYVAPSENRIWSS